MLTCKLFLGSPTVKYSPDPLNETDHPNVLPVSPPLIWDPIKFHVVVYSYTSTIPSPKLGAPIATLEPSFEMDTL